MKSDDQQIRDWNAILLGEVLFLGVLSRAIQSDPDREWLESLIDKDIFSESPLEGTCPELEEGLSLLHTWSQSVRSGISDEQFGNLQADYSRLLIGPAKPLASPWESVYFNEDHMIFQEQTAQVRAWYRRFNLEPEKLYREPDDHIGLELAFLAHLAGLGLQALEMDDDGQFTEILQAQSQFIAEHPLKWVPVWEEQVAKHARSDFYRGLARSIYGAMLVMAEIRQINLPKRISL